jgi:TolB protein
MIGDGSMVIASITVSARSRIAAFRRSDRTWTYLTPQESNSIFPNLSPDGSEILYTSNREGSYDLYTMDLTGSHLNRLTNTAQPELYPAWTPSADEILFSRTGSIIRLQIKPHREQLLSFKGDSAPNWSMP